MPAGPAPITATWVWSSPRGEADVVMDLLSTKSALQARPAEIRVVEPVGPLSDAVVSSQSELSDEIARLANGYTKLQSWAQRPSGRAEPAAVARLTLAAFRDRVQGRQASSVSASTRWAIRKAVLASGTPQ
jgi:hypothetical protein